MRRIAAIATSLLVAALSVVSVPLAVPASAATSAAALAMSVTDMSPWTPVRSHAQDPLTITVRLRNTTSSDIDDVVLSAARGYPVSSQDALNTSLSSHSLPSDLSPIPAKPATVPPVDVPAGGTATATFTTTTGIPKTYPLCLCANAVYPIYLSARESHSGSLLGYTRTFLASTDGAPDVKGNPLQKVDVAWVWPLIDVPHRSAADRVFTDKKLPDEVEAGGRLDNALQVAEDELGRGVPMTLMVDPELVDELAILSSGNYSYLSRSGKSVPGTKSVAAASWLSRLRAVLSEGDVTPEFTPYADPDIQSLTASHLTWHVRLPGPMLSRVRSALALRTIPSTLSWPPGSSVGRHTLDAISATGSTSVLLDDTSVRPTNVGGLPASTAKLPSSHGTLSAALTSPDLQRNVAVSVDDGDAANLSHLPALLAGIAVRADTQPYETHPVFLSAPRYVDPDVTAADTVIEQTTSSTFSEASSVQEALAEGISADSADARARHRSDSAPTLPAGMVQSLGRLTQSLPALSALLTGKGQSAGTAPLLGDLTRGLQRVESAAYLSSSTVSTPAAGTRLAVRLRRQVAGLVGSVHIVRPEGSQHSYSYTLASTNSPLPITVDNSSAYRAFVHISVQTAGGLPGLTTKDLGTLNIDPDSKQTFRVPAHVQRSGRIALTATLTTAHGNHLLGPPVRLTVHSTVFGTIGIVITVVAAVVLFLALALRYVRRIQRLRRKRRASTGDERVPARIGG